MRTYLRGEATWKFNLGLKAVLVGALYAILIQAVQAASPCIVYLSKVNERRMLELTATRDGSTVGKLVYCPVDGDCYIGAVIVDHSSRGTGVSTDLIQHMLDREPNAKSISAVLILDNYRVSGLGSLHRDATPAECAEAVKKTPLLRTAARFGFHKITQCVHSRRADMISITVEAE